MGEEAALEDLMGRYLAGDLSAFDALYARISGRVFSYLRAMTRDRATAEDLLQTTFLKVHRGRAGFIPGSPVLPWVMAIARNALYDESARRRRSWVRVTDTGEVPDVADEGARPGPEGPAPGDPAALLDAMEQALIRLPPAQREAVAMTKQAGLSQREAAVALGTTETAVKLRVHRAYEMLRAMLREGNEADR